TRGTRRHALPDDAPTSRRRSSRRRCGRWRARPRRRRTAFPGAAASTLPKRRSLAGDAFGDNRVAMDTSHVEDRLAALEARVRMPEDQLAVQQLLNRWGPAVDTGDSAAAAALWTDDGVLQSEISYLDGPAGVAAMVESDGQQALIAQGCAHVQAFPLISVAGDRATATGHPPGYPHPGDASHHGL